MIQGLFLTSQFVVCLGRGFSTSPYNSVISVLVFRFQFQLQFVFRLYSTLLVCSYVHMSMETYAKILTAFPCRTGVDHPDTRVIHGWRLSSRTWNPITCPWMKQSLWVAQNRPLWRLMSTFDVMHTPEKKKLEFCRVDGYFSGKTLQALCVGISQLMVTSWVEYTLQWQSQCTSIYICQVYNMQLCAELTQPRHCCSIIWFSYTAFISS